MASYPGEVHRLGAKDWISTGLPGHGSRRCAYREYNMLGDDRLTSGGTGPGGLDEGYVGRCSLFCLTHSSLALQTSVNKGLGGGYNISLGKRSWRTE